ncbi:MAG: VWA domain-containing protein [Flavobacteriales bacterium]|nr:VWA domain-containing protein [Flavobacteriales bacterium]
MLRALSILTILLQNITVFSQTHILVNNSVFDYGNVDKWKNDTAFYTITNTGSTDFFFLPTRNSVNIKTLTPQKAVKPGEVVSVKILYYTQNRGFFKEEIPIFISASDKPFLLTLKGKIVDFHRDALMECPDLRGNEPQKSTSENVEVSVIDGISGESLKGFDVIVKTGEERMLLERSSKPVFYLSLKRNRRVRFTTSLEGYLTAEEDFYVSALNTKLVLKLFPDDTYTKENDEEILTEKDDPIVLKDEPAEDEKKDIESLRKKFNERFKDKKIIEKDVILVKESDKDSSDIIVDEEVEDQSDFDDEGQLNSKKFANNNLIFLIDVSGSMDTPEKLPYLKESVANMVKVLRKEDLVTIITYSSSVNILVEGVPGNNKEYLYKIIESLNAKGLSKGSEGMKTAYLLAERNFIGGGNNQLILVSDGLFSAKKFNPKTIYRLSKQKSDESRIITSCIGFGKNKEALNFLREVSINGNGSFLQIKTREEAMNTLVNEIMLNSRIEPK